MYHLNCNVFFSTKYKVLPHIKLLSELFRSQPHTSVNILTHRTQNSGCFILTQHWAKIHLKNADVKLFACCFSALKQLFAINLIYQLSKILMVRLWCFLQASQEPKIWRILNQDTQKNDTAMSFSTFPLFPCHIVTSPYFILRPFPNLPLDQPVARYLLFPRWLLHLCREKKIKERECANFGKQSNLRVILVHMIWRRIWFIN